MTTFNLTTPVQGLKYQAKATKNGASVFLKNAVSAYVLTDTVTEVTDVDYPSWHTYSVTITRSGTTATATVTPAFSSNLGVGEVYTFIVAGADQAAYNGTVTGTIASGSTFTYTVSGAPATPATGTITAKGGASTVPGCVYLDDRMYVQRTTGEICGSGDGTVTAWEALDFIPPEKEPSLAVAIAKSLNYLVSLKSSDTEFFATDTTILTGSVLASVESAYLKLGCATAQSVIEFDGGVAFISRRDQTQRSREIHVLNGLTPKKISTPEIERILNASTLDEVHALYLATAGHQFCLWTLTDLTIGSIVYDFNTGFWYEWTFLTADSPVTVTITSSDGIATVTKASHGWVDGEPITFAGANQAAYNITENVTYVDANTVTYPVTGSPASPATGTITATSYTESYFPGVAYAQYNNLDLVLHETNGRIYSLEPELYQDDLVPINCMGRLAPIDAGTKQSPGFIVSAAFLGDIVDATIMLRHSENDGDDYDPYRRLDLSTNKDRITRCASTVRRVYEWKYTADAPLRLEALELETKR